MFVTYLTITLTEHFEKIYSDIVLSKKKLRLQNSMDGKILMLKYGNNCIC